MKKESDERIAILEQELRKNLAFQIDYTANFNRSFRRSFQGKYIDPEVSLDEASILYIMNFYPDISQAALGRYLFKGKAHVGKILNEMEKKGFIKRENQKHSITTKNTILPKGRQILEKSFKEFNKIKDAIENTFSQEEIENCLKLLERYREMLGGLVEVKLK